MQSILEFARRTKAELNIPTGRVLEVGSLNINGSPREVFTDAEKYWGVDLVDGPGVDQRVNGERLAGVWGEFLFDTVICMETLEHTIRPWLIAEQMKQVLKPGGHLWISTPTYGFPLHRYPLDCYRFGEDAYRYWLFADMDLLRLEHVVDELNQPAICAVGRKR